MSIHFSLGKKLLRAAVSLGFLGCLIAGQAATNESSVAATKAVMGAGVATPDFCGSLCPIVGKCRLMLTLQVEIGLPGEFGIASEDDDSIEMLRVNIEQRTFGIDREVIGPGFASKTVRSVRPSISPPLLV